MTKAKSPPQRTRENQAAPRARDKQPTRRAARPSKSETPRTADGAPPRSRRKAGPAKAPDKQRLPLYLDAPPGTPMRIPQRRGKPSCTACGLCCSYVAIETDGPDTVKQATQLLWYVYHEGVSLYANGDEWMVQFDSTCIHLQPDYRCGIYDTRPHICREFSEKDCEINTGDDGHTFYTATEFMAHLKVIKPRIYGFVRKHFAPPEEAPRTQLTPFEQRFRSVLSRRHTLGV